MIDELENCLGALRAGIQELGDPLVAQYASGDGHHERVARRLHKLFEDEILTKAGFLHGVPTTILPKIRPRPPADVSDILECWGRLRRFHQDSQNTTSSAPELLTEVLTRLREPRAVPLLVIERLDRWDPEGEMLRWTEQFRSSETLDESSVTLPEAISIAEPNLMQVAVQAAEFCGLWDARNTLKNLAFRDTNSEGFDRVVEWRNSCQQEIRKLVATVEKLLPPIEKRKREPCVWEWHHVASIAKAVLNLPERQWMGHLWECGYVTVRCCDPETCYRMLGHLHCQSDVEYDDKQIRDKLGAPTLGGYRALHTVVTLRSEKSRLSVRFVLQLSDSAKPWRTLLKKRLKDVGQGPSEGKIRVFTPARAYRDLPLGATVLNFAAAVHRDFVGRVDHAIINSRDKVGVLHKLSHGDRVELFCSEKPRMLPPEWEKHVVWKKYIKAALRESFRPLLREAGISRLKAVLEREECIRVEDSELLKNLIDMAIDIANEKIYSGTGSQGRRDYDWWVEQLGLVEFSEHGESLPLKIFLDKFKEGTLIDAIKQLLSRLKYAEDEINIDRTILDKKRCIRMCDGCQPSWGGDLVATIEHDTVLLHKASARCAMGGIHIQIRPRPTLTQFFVIEAVDRVGVVADILKEFHKALVKVIEVVAQRLADQWAVIRIQVDFMRYSQERHLINVLPKIAGVHKVLGPDDPPIQILEGGLPPRQVQRAHSLVPPIPYTYGGVVRDNQCFYGRGEELGNLNKLYGFQCNDKQECGAGVFVTGPLKIGKTSLVLQFGRDLENKPAIFAYYKAGTAQSWRKVEAALREKLCNSINRFNFQWKEKIPDVSGNLFKVVDSTRYSNRKPVVVLVIDEAIRPLWRASDSAIKAISQFIHHIHERPWILLILVGPEAPIGDLNPDLQLLLRSCEQINLTPLKWQEAAALLKAYHLNWRYRITVKNEVARAACELTGGNPYWLNNLGRHMWTIATQGNSTEVIYSHAMLSDAKRQILGEDMLFKDRVFPNGNPGYAPAWLPGLMHIVAGQKDDGIDITELYRVLIHRGVRLDIETLEREISKLVAMGGIKREGDCVKVVAPLLAEWVAKTQLLRQRPLGSPGV